MYKEQANGWLKHLDFILLDLLCLQLALLSAFTMRHGVMNPYVNRLYRNMAFALTFIDIAVIFFGNGYAHVLERGYLKECISALYQMALVMGFSTFYLFVIQAGQGYSRTVLLLTGVFYFGYTYLCRIGWKRLLPKIRPLKETNALLVATTADRADEVIADLRREPRSDLHISGIVMMDGGVHERVDELFQQRYQEIPVVATERSLIEYICRQWVDEILFVLPNREAYQPLMQQIAESGIAVHESLGRAKSEIGKKQIVEKLGGYTVMTTSTNCVTFRQAFIKRALDIVGGGLGSVLALLAILIIGPVIFVQSPGPILFKQVRVGRNGRRFHFLKIRSMVMDAEAMKQQLMEQNRVKDGMMFKLDFDPRIIGAKRLPDGRIKKGIGNFIRDWSIDELPQFFNVLRGDMSLVGTRPPTVDEWERYQLHHRARMAFRPGITGLWQVSGRSNITDFEEVVRLDTKYISEWDFGLDCRIMLATIKAVLGKEGAM